MNDASSTLPLPWAPEDKHSFFTPRFLSQIMRRIVRYYDVFKDFWLSSTTSKHISLLLIGIFLALALLFGLNAIKILPHWFSTVAPATPFKAIQFAFTLVLALEVIGLILAVADSVGIAVSKQLEIMTLILLRDAFTDISHLHTPISVVEDYTNLLQILTVAICSLLLFVFRALFLKFHYIQDYGNMRGYVNAKKCVAFFLLMSVVLTEGYDIYAMIVLHNKTLFFHVFYSLLVFSDIFLVLVGQYFMPSFHVTFRNSGYAISALLMRIALEAPHYAGAAICVLAGLYLLALARATAYFRDTESRLER